MGSYQWVVRGADPDLTKRLVDRAARQRRTTGELLNEALKAYLDPSNDTAPTDDSLMPLEARIEALEARMEAMAVELRQKAAGKPLGAVELVEATNIPLTTEALPEPLQKPQTRKPWTEADDAVLLRIHTEGYTQADAARELGRPSSVVNAKWRKLGLPVEPRKGRKLKPRPKNT